MLTPFLVIWVKFRVLIGPIFKYKSHLIHLNSLDLAQDNAFINPFHPLLSPPIIRGHFFNCTWEDRENWEKSLLLIEGSQGAHLKTLHLECLVVSSSLFVKTSMSWKWSFSCSSPSSDYIELHWYFYILQIMPETSLFFSRGSLNYHCLAFNSPLTIKWNVNNLSFFYWYQRSFI